MDQRARSTTTAANLPHRPEIYFAFMNILIFATLLSGSGWNAVDCTKKGLHMNYIVQIFNIWYVFWKYA